MKKLLGNTSKGKIFVVSAPAGTGKTTLVDRLTDEFPSVVRSISYTTRSPRPDEEDGKDYFFVTKEKFQSLVEQGAFVESVTLYDDYYGTSQQWVEKQLNSGKHVILVIDTQGAILLKKLLTAHYIFVMPPTLDELERRLRERQTESPSAIQGRLDWAKHEIEIGKKEYDYLIINDNLDTAYQVMRSIIIAEEHRQQCH